MSKQTRWNGKQCRPWSDYSSVCPNLSVRKLRIITVFFFCLNLPTSAWEALFPNKMGNFATAPGTLLAFNDALLAEKQKNVRGHWLNHLSKLHQICVTSVKSPFQQYFSHIRMMEGWTWRVLCNEAPFRFRKNFCQFYSWIQAASQSKKGLIFHFFFPTWRFYLHLFPNLKGTGCIPQLAWHIYWRTLKMTHQSF